MIDLTALMLAALVGLPVSLVFFWGLAVGMRKALGSSKPALWLFISFMLRASWLVVFALLLIRWLEPLSALLGLLLAFVVVRMASVRWVRHKGVGV